MNFGRASLFAVAAVAAALALAPGHDHAAAQVPAQVCLGDLTAADATPAPGPPVRFGINPSGEAGAIGPTVPVTPGTKAQTLKALGRLRPPGAPFVVRLNRLFWSGAGQGIVEKYLRRAKGYAKRGYLVEVQLRYHPRADQEGDIEAWTRFVRHVVDLFGPVKGVVALQVTNEVNFFPIAPDASDSSYRGAKDALIQGVIAAKAEAIAKGFGRLEIGFNWAFRTDPSTEASFWGYLRDHGGPSFVSAVDWVGLDAYPGTIFPPVEPPGGERDGIVNAMSSLRDCFMPIAGLTATVPIHVEENGWPTGPGRSEASQLAALKAMVGAVIEFRGTYNVTDYRWFDLRDHNSSSVNFQHHYGLMRDDYTEKPAFAAYRDLIRASNRPGGANNPP